MRLFNLTALMIAIVTSSGNFVVAQYNGFGGNNVDPMAAMDQIMAELNQRQQMLEREMQVQNRKVIDDFRRMTNDYTSPDQVILNRSMQMARQQNPAAFRALDIQHQNRMRGLQQQFDAGQAAYRARQQASDASMQSYWNRSAAMDRMQHNTINGIWERSDYINPATGQISNIGWGQANQFHTGGNNNTFYTNQNYRQFQNDGNGFWQELDEIR